MELNNIIHNFLIEIKSELKKDNNINILKKDIINPILKEIIESLYPYIFKILIIIIIFFIIVIILILLNIRIIFF